MSSLCFPLDGVKVVELATVVAAPSATRILSDYGAEVIKVESPPYGDLARVTGIEHQLPVEDGNNPYFDQLNAGKRLLALNLKQPEDMEAFMKLLADADIFVTNIRGKSLRKLGIDYDSLKDKFPGLVYAHFTGVGTCGEEADRACYDQTAFWSRTGAIRDSLTEDAAPASMSFAFGDLASSTAFVDAILMAYIGKLKHGKGAYASASLLKTALWCNSISVINAQPQYGKQYPVSPYDVSNPFSTYYCCSDGEWIGMFDRDYEGNREYWAEVFELPELLSDESLATLESMIASGRTPSIVKGVEKAFKKRDSKEWAEILTARDVIFETVKHYKDVYKDPQAIANNMFEAVEYKDGEVTYMPTPPVEFIGYDRKPFMKAGPIGSDNDELI